MNNKYKLCVNCHSALVCVFKVEFNFLPVCKTCEKEIKRKIKSGVIKI